MHSYITNGLKNKREIRKYFDINENEDTTYQKVLDAATLDKKEQTELKANERKAIIKIQLEIREIVEKQEIYGTKSCSMERSTTWQGRYYLNFHFRGAESKILKRQTI